MNFTLRATNQYPPGTSVGAYATSRQPLTGQPPVVATATATVAADNSLTFTGLLEDQDYVAWANVAGQDVYVTFHPDVSIVEPRFEAMTDSAVPVWNAGLNRFVGIPVGTSGQQMIVRSDGTLGYVDTQVNVKAWGLKGDDVTDDTAKANTMLSSVPNGTTLYWPLSTGRYMVTGLAATGKTGLRFTGQGVIHNTGAGVDAVNLVNCDDTTWDGPWVQGGSGTRDALHFENCQRTVVVPRSGGTQRAMMWAQQCRGIKVRDSALGIGANGPYHTGVQNPESGIVLTHSAGAGTGCNEFLIDGGFAVVGQTLTSTSNGNSQYQPGWGVQAIWAEGGIINTPIPELSPGGVYLFSCSKVYTEGAYGEFDPSGIEYGTGTANVHALSTAVVGTGTAWSVAPGSPEVAPGFPGHYLIGPLGAGMAYARVAGLADDTHLTLFGVPEPFQINGTGPATGWTGADNATMGYLLVSADLFLDNCQNCVVGPVRCDAIMLRNTIGTTFSGAICRSLFMDSGSNGNTGSLRVNFGGAGTIVDQGANVLDARDYATGAVVRDDTARLAASQTFTGVQTYGGLGANTVFLAALASGNAANAFAIRNNGTTEWGDGTSARDTSLQRAAANYLTAVTADFGVATAGRGLRVKEGSNAKQGTATLVAGSVVVSNTSVTANSRILLTSNVDGGAPGWLRVSARTAGTSFTITSSSGTDTSTVAYQIFEPA